MNLWQRAVEARLFVQFKQECSVIPPDEDSRGVARVRADCACERWLEDCPVERHLRGEPPAF